jgi:hypothetical protein
VNAPLVFSPDALGAQEHDSLTALEAFGSLRADFLARVESCTLDYAELARENRALAEAAQALAGELFKTSASYAMVSAINDESGATQ